MNTPTTDDQLVRLTSKLLDGMISDEEHLHLNQMLMSSRSNRLRYLEVVRIESLLHWEPSSMDLPEHEEKSSKLISFPLFAWVGSMAATLVAMIGIWWAFRSSSDNKSQFAEIHQQSVFFDEVNPAKLANSSFNPNHRVLGKQDSSKPFSELSIRPSAHEHAREGMEILRSNDRTAHGGAFELHGLVKRWNRQPYLHIPSEKGVLPASGSKMLSFEKMSINVESQIAHVEETVQVLDVREALKNNGGTTARIFAAVKFNQSFGATQEGAEFGLTLQAFKDRGNLSEQSLARVEKNLPSDRDPSTWNELSSEFEIPANADYIVVSLSAKKYGPDSLLANTSSYYSDDLELSLLLGDQPVIGPI